MITTILLVVLTAMFVLLTIVNYSLCLQALPIWWNGIHIRLKIWRSLRQKCYGHVGSTPAIGFCWNSWILCYKNIAILHCKAAFNAAKKPFKRRLLRCKLQTAVMLAERFLLCVICRFAMQKTLPKKFIFWQNASIIMLAKQCKMHCKGK